MKKSQQPNQTKTNTRGVLLILVLSPAFILLNPMSSFETASAATNATADASVTITDSCSLSAINSDHQASLSLGTYGTIDEDTVFTITCNGLGGYKVYAIGDGDETDKTSLHGAASDIIATGTDTEGDVSSWHFKLSQATNHALIAEGFDAIHAIPAASALVVSRAAGTIATAPDSFHVTYSSYISPTQSPGTYTGKVKYTLVQEAAPVHDPNLGHLGDMQDFNCSTMLPNVDDYGTVTDARDNNVYTVAKLKDNLCWMTKNLQIENKTISSSDSDLSSGTFVIPASSTSGFDDYATPNVYIDDTYGGYYTYAAATANTGKGILSDNASGSICPKGWRLPTQAEFTALINAYDAGSDGSKLLQPPVNMLYGGYYYNGSAYKQDSSGYYWPSTAGSTSDYAYRLYFGSSDVNTDYGYRRNGHSVRCVAR